MTLVIAWTILLLVGMGVVGLAVYLTFKEPIASLFGIVSLASIFAFCYGVAWAIVTVTR